MADTNEPAAPVAAPVFDKWKFMARSFLLPVATAGMTFYLALTWGPDKIDAVIKVGALLAGVTGIFNVTEAWKTASAAAASGKGGE